MARMSKRAFNNVVIFAMLGMIFLFNLDRFVPESKLPANQPLLPEGVYVLKIEQHSQKLERVGQQWRFVGLNESLSTSPEQHIQAWRDAVIQASKPPRSVDQTEPLVAVVWVAGQAQGLVYAFVKQDQNLWVNVDSQWYIVVNQRLDQLLPWLQHSQEM
ncbi:hypothetical protein [Alteromonas gilva]|uniref:DUF4340 domain-containing protein n=1 Tax=Alteromonas gilva TaxID=2987522 RepID=A0ABT5L462_9ALTE|nr:hypothetical protein [Alteromonas gilva]MDC8831835.1 hypothetical protein [Alteromonas gilva]